MLAEYFPFPARLTRYGVVPALSDCHNKIIIGIVSVEIHFNQKGRNPYGFI